MVRRLEGARRNPQAEIVRHEKSSPKLPAQTAARDSGKKSPGIQSVRALCESWSQARKGSPTVPNQLAEIAINLKPSQLTPAHTAALVATWKQSFTHGTRRTYSTELKRLLRYLGRPELSDTVPRVGRSAARRPIAQAGEVDRLLAVAPAWLRCAVTIAAQTGMRLGDCLKFAPANCNDDLTVLRIIMGKTQRTVAIPISPELRSVIENALRQYLDGSSDSALVLRRLNRLQVSVGRDHRDLELLSEAFGLYMRAWFAAHSPSVAETTKTMRVGEGAYKAFARHLGERFSAGHRFLDDLPKEFVSDEEPSEIA